MYKALEGSGIIDEQLAEEMAPSISNIFGNQIAAVLAKPMLWEYFEPCMEDAVVPDIRRAVVGAFIQFNHQVEEIL